MSYGDLSWQDHAVFAHEKDQEIKSLTRQLADCRAVGLSFKNQRNAAEERLATAHAALADAENAIRSYESALATQAEELTAYKDYYGTSVAQVKHLQSCSFCCEGGYEAETVRCPDYPSE